LRSVVTSLMALCNENELRPPTYHGNPKNPKLLSLSVWRTPFNKLGQFVMDLHGWLVENQISYMFDSVVMQPVICKTSEEVRLHGLKKKMYLNFYLCDWTRENIINLTEKKFSSGAENYYIPTLAEIINDLEAEIECMEYEEACVDPVAPRYSGRKTNKSFRAPLISAEQALEVMSNLGIGESMQQSIATALGLVPNKEEASCEEG